MSQTDKRAFWRGKPAILDWALAALGAIICTGLAGYFWIDLNAPAALAGDHFFVQTMVKSYINGHGFRFDSQLGYPGVRDWLYFPDFDLSQRLVLWLSGHLTHNVFQSVHALYMIGLAAMFAAAYWVLRHLGIRRWIAFIGAASSVLTPFLASRAYVHDFLALYFTVPLGMGLALSLGTGRWGDDLKAFLLNPLTLTTIVITGTSGLYYCFYTLMFLAFIAVTISIAQRRTFPIQAALCVGAPMFLLLVFSGYGFDLLPILSGKIPSAHRLPFEQILYGLDLPSAALPFKLLPHVGQSLDQAAAAVPDAFAREGNAEWPALPLTLILLLSPILAAIGIERSRTETATAGAPMRLIGLASVFVVFAMLFGARGGTGFIFNLLITPEIRGDSRLMPFLVFAAVVILCAAAELMASSRATWLRIAGPLSAAALLAISAWPTIGTLDRKQKGNLASPLSQSMLEHVPIMLKIKDRENINKVLELPAASWPEALPAQTLDIYSEQMPYILDKIKSKTRWSYGASNEQPWFDLVAAAASQPVSMMGDIRTFGFDGVLLHKQGYDPAGLAATVAALASACLVYDDPLMSLYAFHHKRAGIGC